MGSTPIATTRGRSSITVQTGLARGLTRHRLYVYGDDERVHNPGDLLVETFIGDGTAFTATVLTYFSGDEVHNLAEVALACAAERDANPWLAEPVTRAAS